MPGAKRPGVAGRSFHMSVVAVTRGFQNVGQAIGLKSIYFAASQREVGKSLLALRQDLAVACRCNGHRDTAGRSMPDPDKKAHPDSRRGCSGQYFRCRGASSRREANGLSRAARHCRKQTRRERGIAAVALKSAAPDGATLLQAPIVVPVLDPLVFTHPGFDPARVRPDWAGFAVHVRTCSQSRSSGRDYFGFRRVGEGQSGKGDLCHGCGRQHPTFSGPDAQPRGQR